MPVMVCLDMSVSPITERPILCPADLYLQAMLTSVPVYVIALRGPTCRADRLARDPPPMIACRLIVERVNCGASPSSKISTAGWLSCEYREDRLCSTRTG